MVSYFKFQNKNQNKKESLVMRRSAVIGDELTVEFEMNPSPIGQRPYFSTSDNVEIDMPIGTSLYFLKGFMVRQHDPVSFVGSYGHPSKNFWTVLFHEKDGQPGLLLPEGEEEITLHFDSAEGPKPETFRLHRKQCFIPLRQIRGGIARVIGMPN